MTSQNGTWSRGVPIADVDRGTPVLFWKHFHTDDARQLARLTVDFYHDYRLAAAKVMPDIPILFEELSLSSWRQVSHLRRFGPVGTVGRAREYVQTVRLCRSMLDPDDTLLVTVFSPLAMVSTWCGKEGLREMLAGPRHITHAVLWALSGVVNELASECVHAGADGIYFSCWGQDVLTAEEYSELGTPYDLAGLRGAAEASLRILHVHGDPGPSATRYQEYPVDMVGWSQVEGNLSCWTGRRNCPARCSSAGSRKT